MGGFKLPKIKRVVCACTLTIEHLENSQQLLLQWQSVLQQQSLGAAVRLGHEGGGAWELLADLAVAEPRSHSELGHGSGGCWQLLKTQSGWQQMPGATPGLEQLPDITTTVSGHQGSCARQRWRGWGQPQH